MDCEYFSCLPPPPSKTPEVVLSSASHTRKIPKLHFNSNFSARKNLACVTGSVFYYVFILYFPTSRLTRLVLVVLDIVLVLPQFPVQELTQTVQTVLSWKCPWQSLLWSVCKLEVLLQPEPVAGKEQLRVLKNEFESICNIRLYRGR